MFKAKITLSFLILLIFLIVTSIIKNQTRGLEKKIIQLNNKISLNEKSIFGCSTTSILMSEQEKGFKDELKTCQ